MKVRILALATAAFVATPTASHAQVLSTVTASATAKEQAAERRQLLDARVEAASAVRAARTPEARDAAPARRALAVEAMSTADLQYRADMRTYQHGLSEKAAELRTQVQAGTMTSAEMAAELKAYRETKRPTAPAAEPEPTKPAATEPAAPAQEAPKPRRGVAVSSETRVSVRSWTR